MMLEAEGRLFSSSGVRVIGVVVDVDEGALGIIERGGRILKI